MAEKKSLVLRISKELWDEVRQMAAAEFRSVNGQIEYMLQESVRRRGRRAPGKDEEQADT